MALARMLYFHATQHNIDICIMHIPGVQNNVADAISHFQMVRFWQLVPMAYPTADPSLLDKRNHSTTPPAMPKSWHCHLNQGNLYTSQESPASNTSVTSMSLPVSSLT